MKAGVTAVVLTRGDRRDELRSALGSVLGQRRVDVDIVVVWNGVEPGAAVDGAGEIAHVALEANTGVPEGRNRGAREAHGEFLLFLDDDARLMGEEGLAQVIGLLVARSDVAAVGLRVVDEDGATARRHVARWGGRAPGRSGEVTAFVGGAVVIRREAFEQVGGYAGEFFYSMEETDLAWRLVDAGWRIWYAADVLVRHPRTMPSRHPAAAYRTARNRLWLADRNLPAALGVVYLANWLLINLVRAPRAWRVDIEGYRDGWRSRPGPRRPMRWRSVWRLARLGRPPIA